MVAGIVIQMMCPFILFFLCSRSLYPHIERHVMIVQVFYYYLGLGVLGNAVF